MSIIKAALSPLKIFDGLIDRIFAAVFAVVFAQLPMFIAQYIQRLGGHLDELTRIILQYREAAKGSGKTLEQYISTHLDSGITDFINTGKIMESNLARFDSLTQALESLRGAGAVQKPFIFLKNIDLSIAKGTLQDFTPGVPVNIEGAIYALCGLITGMIIYYIIKRIAGKALGSGRTPAR
jgi:hypothetical protein